MTNVSRLSSKLKWEAPSNTPDIARYEVCMFPTAIAVLGCQDGDWRSINTGTSLTLGKFIISGVESKISSGWQYQARIRAVDTSENVSNYTTFTWDHQ